MKVGCHAYLDAIPVNIVKMIEPSKMVPDAGVLGGVGLLYLLQGITLLTAVGGLMLICLRLIVATQEYRINRLKLKTPTKDIAHEPGA